MSDTSATTAIEPRYIIIIVAVLVVCLLIVIQSCVCYYCIKKKREERLRFQQFDNSSSGSTLKKKWLDVPTQRTVAGNSMRQVIMKRDGILDSEGQERSAAPSSSGSGAQYNEIDKETSHVVYQTGYSSVTTSHQDADSGRGMSPSKGSPKEDSIVDLTQISESEMVTTAIISTPPATAAEVTVVEMPHPDSKGRDNEGADLDEADYISADTGRPETLATVTASSSKHTSPSHASLSATNSDGGGEYIYSSLLERTKSTNQQPLPTVPIVIPGDISTTSTPTRGRTPTPPPRPADEDLTHDDDLDGVPMPPASMLTATEPPARSPTPPPVAAAATFNDLSKKDDDAMVKSVWQPRALSHIEIIEK